MNEKLNVPTHSKRLILCMTHCSPQKKNLENLVNETKNRINEPENLFNEHENSFLRYKVILDKVIECPGCSLFLPKEEQCARHLLQECLFPKNLNDSETLRIKFTQWLIKFFYTHFIKSASDDMKVVNNYQRGLKRKHIENILYKVQLPSIPFDLQCPVCQKYFHSHEVCSKHLFEDCLQTSNSENAISILSWFEDYLRTNSKSKHYITDLDQYRSLEKRCVCNYCKKEFYNKECMLYHFSSSHRREDETGDSLCNFCNFKPGCDGQLFRHLIKMHVKCGCMEKQKDFTTLKTHLSGCPKSDSCLCPMCQEVKVRSYETESEFERHILNCRKSVPLKFTLHDLYTECDICWQFILKCNLDIHVAEHIKSIDAVRRQSTKTFVNFNDLKDLLSEKEVQRLRQLLE